MAEEIKQTIKQSEEKKNKRKEKNNALVNAGEYRLGRFDSIPELSVALAIRHMSIMLRSGISLMKAVSIMSEQADDQLLRKVFASLAWQIQNGTSLADSMRRYPKVFSPIVVSIIEIGEQGGGLDQNLLFLTDYLKKKHELKKKIQGALFYPLIILALTAVEMSGVIFFVLPKVENLFLLFKDVPTYVAVIMGTAGFIRLNWYWLLLGFIVVLVAALKYFSTDKGKKVWSKLELKLPIIKKVVKLQLLTSTARTIGILMSNGIPLVKAVSITGDTTTNHVYKNLLIKISEEADKGKALAQSLMENKQYFPETFIRLIELGESSGALEENLTYIYEFYSEELEDVTTNMAALIEPLLLIFIGLMIGMLAITIIGPIYSLTSSIN